MTSASVSRSIASTFVTELNAIVVVLEEWLIFGGIVYDLTRCGLDQRVCTVDKMHDELRLATAHRA